MGAAAEAAISEETAFSPASLFLPEKGVAAKGATDFLGELLFHRETPQARRR